MNYAVLKNEHDADPLGRGYAGMTPEEAAADLNTEYRTFNRATISGEELARMSTMGDLQALSDRAFALWQSYTGLESISIEEGTATRDLLAALFPAGSDTRNSIVAYVTEDVSQSRAEELGLGRVTHADIIKIRNW